MDIERFGSQPAAAGPGSATTIVDDDWIVTLEALDHEECWRMVGLAAAVGVGRIAFCTDGAQHVLPVNFACARRSIVVRTAERTMLHRLGSGADVAFEVDHLDPDRKAGWSVLIQGRLWPMTTPTDLLPDDRLRLHPWAAGDRDSWIRVIPSHVSGRRVSRRRVPTGEHLPVMPPD
jgi:hypothetical protein